MGKYEDKGETAGDSVLDAFTLGGWSAVLGSTHVVEDEDTGEMRELFVGPGQSVGEAIAEGQWKS